LQVLATKLKLESGFWVWLNALDLEQLGYAIVGLFVLAWATSIVIWKTRHIEERWQSRPHEPY
jgi:high-affinity nickel-transport protein